MNARDDAPGDLAEPDGADGHASPRPPTPDEIVAMLDEAAEQNAPKKRQSASAGRAVLFWPIWIGAFLVLGAVAYIMLTARQADTTTLAIAAFAALTLALFIAFAASKMLSPMLLAGAVIRRASGKSPGEAAELAGADILSALGLGERILEDDQDARLVTRRDGVVAYANHAYFKLARKAGAIGGAGLPPRIDRLFAAQGGEATKIFRLCRAAKGGERAEEVVHQAIGGGPRRRFALSVAPIGGSEDYVVWRLREMPLEDAEHDMLAAAYADFPKPVFALEKSGQIAWANAAMREALGVTSGGLRHIDDIVLGETADLARALWRIDHTPVAALARRKDADPVDAIFTAFRRGGVGEGFVCVAFAADEPEEDGEEVTLSGDVSESPFGVAIVEGELNRDARIVEANKAFVKDFGALKKNAPLSKRLSEATLEELGGAVKQKSKSGAAPKPVETTVGKGAASRVFAIYPRPVRRRRGSYGVRKTILYSVDITERKRMEEDYAQDQKLRGIGELASKVAHDFNNYLQVVLGHCERLMLKHPAGDPAYPELVQIRENAQRAANTTKQLLAFSRKQTLKREVVSITEVLRDFSRFLTRAIGEKVRLELVNGRGLPVIKVDRFQLETAIMNLAVNARDAMAPNGGTLTIKTSALNADEMEKLIAPGFEAQDYVLIEVADTGPGVPEEIVEKIFDPFFTTKESGKGTGLGLSTVYGIIRQMDGFITLKSGKGGGAKFEIYLPAHGEEASVEAPTPAAPREARDLTGAGRILIVEDEDSVRTFVVAALNDCGYEVSSAEDGEDALEILREEGADFDLVLSDVMMNVLDGPSFVTKAREEFDLKSKVIFMSAYAETAVREQLDVIEGAGYIQKPFTLKGLAEKVKETLFPTDER